MSETGTRLSLTAAEVLADSIRSDITGESHVVGSVRRKKAAVGDIEIMVHRDAKIELDVGMGPMFPGDFKTIRGGPHNPKWRYWQLEYTPQKVKIDLFRFDDDNRGSIMLIRTGPAEFSQRFVTMLKRRWLKHEGGYIRDLDDGELAPCPNEREAFRLAGIPYIEPEHRST